MPGRDCWQLAGTPSDELAEVAAIGDSDVATMFVSMSEKDPDGRDAEYLAWHALDHRPEQYRVPGLRGALRLVSTPECRARRAASAARYDGVDHVMTYFFDGPDALGPFGRLGAALGRGGRMPRMLPAVERAVFRASGRFAASHIKAGADVLPWWPATGVYLLVERGSCDGSPLTAVDGVAGAWWAEGADLPGGSADVTGLQITYCFLDDDPAAVGTRIQPSLEKRWSDGGIEPLLAAPFHIPLDRDWGRYLPG